jgi:hypothetical protein
MAMSAGRVSSGHIPNLTTVLPEELLLLLPPAKARDAAQSNINTSTPKRESFFISFLLNKFIYSHGHAVQTAV